MDHIRILNQIKDEKTLEKAFNYAIHDRIQKDYYFDYFEIDYMLRYKDAVIQEIKKELSRIDNYTQRPSYAYYPPQD